MGDKQFQYETMKPFIKLKNDMGSSDIHYSLFLQDIPCELNDVALKELNETEENKTKGLSKLREFLKKKGIFNVEDHVLLTVLRASKYNIKHSEKKLIKYLQIQDTITNWLQTADLKRVEKALIHKVVGFLPYRNKHGRVILYSTPYDINLELFDLDDAFLCAFCLLFYALSSSLTTVTGLSYIGECKAPALSILYPVVKAYRQYLPSILSLPIRIRKIDFINENFIIKWGYNIMKPFLPSKFVQRVVFNGCEIQNLQKTYHPAILPEEFGGTMGPMNPQLYAKDFLNFVQKLKSRSIFLKTYTFSN